MLEYEGPLLRAALSRTLWLVLVGPLTGVLWQVLVTRRRLARASGAQQRLELRRAGWTAAAGVLAAAAGIGWHAAVLARLPREGRALYDHVAPGPPVAGLEGPLDLWLDTRSAVASGLACLVAGAAIARLVTGPTFERTWARGAWLQLALLGALLAFLGDSLVTIAAGWALSGLAAVWLAGWTRPGVGVAAASWSAAAVAALALGSAFLFWGTGGEWDEEGYLPEVDTPVVAVRLDGRPGEVTLTMTAPAGARVQVDGSKAAPLHVPFVRAPLSAGSHSIALEGGAQLAEAHFTARHGTDVMLVPVGPTLSLHAMRDALTLVDRAKEPVVRRALEARALPGGISVVAAALLCWLLALGALAAIVVPLGAPGTLSAVASGATTSMLAPVLLVRADFLLPSARHAGLIVACVGASIVLAATWRALAHEGAARWLVFLSGAAPGLVCVVLGLCGQVRGDHASEGALGVLVAMVAIGLGVAALQLGTSRSPRARDDLGPEAPEASMLMRMAERLGGLLASMERWVVDAVANSVATVARIAAWIVATVDDQVVGAPADRAADGVLRVAHAAEPVVGGSLARLVWAALALAAVAVFIHALWPGG